MTSGRAGVFDDDDDDALDVTSFAPKPAAPPGISSDQVRVVSEGAQFRSRDPAPPAEKRPPRRYRTGRNVQLNVKARAEAIETFYAIADAQGWVLGEAFEQAVAALERELAGRSDAAAT
ncbi:MAG TPA: hypothetical protein VFN42_05965 [Acetobacteraceae bacterium]|nr:hypothetical protein [Acetobacteraceae bacterium]